MESIKEYKMKRNILTIPFCILAIALSGQNNQTFKADVNVEAEEEIKKMEFYLASLLVTGDYDTYSSYLTDDYIRINQNGIVSTKEEVLSQFRSNPGKGSTRPHDLTVRVYGDVAILNGMLDIESQNGDEITKRSSVFTKIFILRDGKWYLASLHGTPAR